MKKKRRHTAKQIIRKLREAEGPVLSGASSPTEGAVKNPVGRAAHHLRKRAAPQSGRRIAETSIVAQSPIDCNDFFPYPVT